MSDAVIETVKTTEQTLAAGIIGLGAMGLQMGKHMAAKGLAVSGYDIAPEACARAAGVGVRIVDSAEAVAAQAQIVFVIVATDEQVEDVVLRQGLLEGLAPGSIICIASSVSPDICRKLSAAAAPHQVDVLDTPLILGQEAANNGTLTIFAGGTEAAFDRAKPVLHTFGRQVLYLGGSGCGQIAKSVNNLLLWACMSANFEALSFAKGLGMDMPRLIAALAHSSGANWSLSRWGKSTGKWAEKDMDVALELAQDIKLPMPLAALVDQLMKSINQEKMRALIS